MIEQLLTENEGKILEFKEKIQTPLNLIKTVVAFANTAGGTVVVGVKDKTREIIGVKNILVEEERLANIIADSVAPLLIPDIEIITYRNRELLLVRVPHIVGPYYVKSAGLERGIYIRLGSTNRIADIEIQEALKRLSKNISFDELPCISATIAELDESLIASSFNKHRQKILQKNYPAFGITVSHLNRYYPSNGAILLFGVEHLRWFPDALVRCVCFRGIDKSQILDQKDIEGGLFSAVDETIAFIERHTNLSAEIDRIERKDIREYPPVVIREAVINAILHADYTLKGSSIQVAIFSNRIEITNPGALPFGQTIESALAGVSRLRNRAIGRLFRKLKLVEKLGSGLQRMVSTCMQFNMQVPCFEEINNHFRVTLFPSTCEMRSLEIWQKQLLLSLSQDISLKTKEIAVLWKVTPRTARTRLQKMQALGLIKRVATSHKDPNAVFVLSKP